MGIYSDAFDEAGKILRKESRYKIKEIELRGKMHEPLICEKRLDRIFAFVGTGEKRFFLELIKEVEIMGYNEMLRAWDKGDIQPSPWIDEYIIQNNFNVIYNPGDIVLRYPSMVS
ncbi:MAG: hypothetical protein H7281_13405 [Bacteriovorax sp.]|nr:hypothetical protein [Bacteriovorax sp.]